MADQPYLEYVNARVPALRRLAYSLTGDSHAADDLVQETLTKLYLRWRRASAAENLDAYVHAMLVRTFLDDRRKGWWRVRLPGSMPDPVAAPNASSPEDRAVVRSALGKVPPRQQAVLVLRFVHDLPVDEVARVLGCSQGTVKSQCSRGLATLRRHLGDFAEERFSRTGGRS